MNIGNYLRRYKWDIGIASMEEGHRYDNEKWDFHIVKAPKERWFADPFILDVTDEEIIILAEEYEHKLAKGRLARLIVDKKSYKLKSYKIVLELPTHLSFPIYFRNDGKIYVYPENSESGKCTLYLYDCKSDSFTPVRVLSDEPLTDAVIFDNTEDSYILATKIPNQNSNALQVYKLQEPSGGYGLIQQVIFSDNTARGAGKVFIDQNRIIRPAQNCNGGYGVGLVFQEIIKDGDGISISELFRKDPPQGYEGMHTYNSCKGYAVIDLHKRRYPIIFRSLQYLKHLLFGKPKVS